jgi:hypothetical protein
VSSLVPPDHIEEIVGAKRHPSAHYGRAVSTERTVYILHSQACKDSGIDLRKCLFSLALDRGIENAYCWSAWQDVQDRPVRLQTEHGFLIPAAEGAVLDAPARPAGHDESGQ